MTVAPPTTPVARCIPIWPTMIATISIITTTTTTRWTKPMTFHTYLRILIPRTDGARACTRPTTMMANNSHC